MAEQTNKAQEENDVKEVKDKGPNGEEQSDQSMVLRAEQALTGE